MTQSFLFSTLLILAEVIAVLLVLVFFSFRSYLKLKSSLKEKPVENNSKANPVSENILLTEYLKTEIERTTQRVKQAEQSESEIPITPLKRRLELLLSERQVSELISKKGSKNKYWNIVNSHYEDNTSHDMNTDANSDTSQGDNETILALRTQIEELQSYKDLFDQENQKLQEDNNTTDDLQVTANDNGDSEEYTQLQITIDTLKAENDALQSKLDNMSQSQNDVNAISTDMHDLLEVQKELKIYKELVNQADKKIADSLETINELQSIIKETDATDELKRMERKIQKLNTDNVSLKERLDQTLRPNTNMLQTSKLLDQQTKDEELGMYMDLILQANEKLKNTNATIAELRNIIDNSTPSEELNQMEDMVEILTKDNIELQKQLDNLTASKHEHTDGEADANSQTTTAKTDELSKYKNMVEEANISLNKSNETIEELKRLVNQSPADDEINQMESMIAALSQDNTGLRNQLDNIKVSSKEEVLAIEKESQQQQDALREELNMYMELVTQANSKLKESKATIDELKSIVNDSADTSEITQMENMLDKLSLENMELSKQLDAVNSQLQDSLNNIESLKSIESESLKELTIIKEEKWFLEQQIQHLLQQNEDNKKEM